MQPQPHGLCWGGGLTAGALCWRGTGTAWAGPQASSGSPSVPSWAAGHGWHSPLCTADQPTWERLPALAASKKTLILEQDILLCAFPSAWEAPGAQTPVLQVVSWGPEATPWGGHGHSHRVWPPEQQPATARQATTRLPEHKSLLWGFGDTEAGTQITPESPAAFTKCSTHLYILMEIRLGINNKNILIVKEISA